MIIEKQLRGALIAAIGLASSLTVACGQIELPVNLVATSDSQITITLPFDPPYDILQSSLVGGAQATIAVDVDIFKLLSPHGIMGTIVVDDVLIAGTEVVIGGFLPSGTICVTPSTDPPGGGTILLRPLLNRADIQMDLFTQISLTDPTVAALLGPPLPFDAHIEDQVPLSLADLLGLLLGGGSGSFEVHQEISTVLPEDLPLVGGAPVVADVTLVNADEFPTGGLLDDCTGL
jgi:hypothetical protein